MRKLIFICLILISCRETNKIYYYITYNDENTIIGYEKRLVFFKNGKRLDSLYRYNRAKKLIYSGLDVYRYNVDDYSLKSNDGTIKLITKNKDTCYNYSILSTSFKSCYLGKDSITINDMFFRESYGFIISDTGIDGVSNKMVFDEDFILLQKEYVSGFLHYYRTDVTNNINGLDN